MSAYYTIECGVNGNAYLCGWDCYKNHLNYHEIKSAVWPEGQKGLWKVIEAKILIDFHAKNKGLNLQPDKTILNADL